jgi:hypothetical protein
MKKMGAFAMAFFISAAAWAELRCKDNESQIVVHPEKKKVEVVRDGQTHQLDIVGKNHHAYRMFGENTYEVEGGIILGVKSNKVDRKKDLTVFRNGSPVSTFKNCSL